MGVLALAWMSLALAGSSVQMDSISVDGLELRELKCDLEKAPFMGALVVVGVLATQRDALHACAPEGGAFRVQWTWHDGTTAKVLAGSKEGASACVVTAISKLPSDMKGVCTGTILTGPTEAAEAARLTLAPAVPPAAEAQNPPGL